jgi:polysaccharide biosynthesis/export protein
MVRGICGGVLVCALLACLVAAGGCSDQDYMNPTAIGRFRPTPVVNVILDSLGVGEEEPSPYAGAEDPKPVDLTEGDEDYVIGPGDTLRIAIFELLLQGQTDIRDYVVTESGKISVPEVGSVQAGGLTERQLESELKQILSPAILKSPSVTVSLQTSEQKVFAINGDGVNRPGRYPIPRSGFRLTDALATAGSVGQFNVSYVYVTRQVTGKEQGTENATSGPTSRFTPDRMHGSRHVMTAAEMVSEEELRSLAAPAGMRDVARRAETDAAASGTAAVDNPREEPSRDAGGRIEWVFRDGQWVPVRAGGNVESIRPEPVTRPEQAVASEPQPTKAEPQAPQSFGWEQVGSAGAQTRLIKIPVKKLLSGDPKYDIVVKSGDKITVPLDIVGEFCVYGHVNQVGYIPLTGRPMTLTGAVAAAGGLGELAWPENVEVRRRIDENHEAIVMVNLKRIAEGSQPDFFIKPHDIVNVGTHPSARWLAILRTAFRATYGFGFIYDRNFADRDVNGSFNVF